MEHQSDAAAFRLCSKLHYHIKQYCQNYCLINADIFIRLHAAVFSYITHELVEGSACILNPSRQLTVDSAVAKNNCT